MGKGKKGGKRMTKDALAAKIQEFFQHEPDRVFSFKEIFRSLKLDTHPLKMLAIDIMEEMAWDDFLSRVGDSAYRLHKGDMLQDGIFLRKTNGRNSFVPDGSDQPVLVAERNSLYAMNGDRVRVSYMARRHRHAKEAQVVEILARAKDTFVGKLVVDDDMAFLMTNDNQLPSDILIPLKRLNGGRTNDKAVVKVMRWPDSRNRNILGEVVDVLGPSGDNNAEMHTILAQYGLPYEYPKNVEEAANKISDKITADDIAEREDFRGVFTCTIDPKDAKDFDDALSIRRVKRAQRRDKTEAPSEGEEHELWEVGVHIADVSHYVKDGSVIDREAQSRATSVYLVDRTIPMLPERLCNYICSLRPDEDKLAYSVIFLMDDEANIVSYRIVHTVIRSQRRYVYDEVQRELGVTPDAPGQEPDAHRDELRQLWHLASQLRDRRFKNGAMQFESEEMKFEIDEMGRPLRCYFKHTFEANHLVEEFMLLANRSVAEYIGAPGKSRKGQLIGAAKATHAAKGYTLPYRIHDNPDPTKLEALRDFIVRFGYKLKTAGTKGETAKSLNKLMSDCSGQAEQKLIQTVALRAMMKAKYSVHNIGHYGLAFDYYTHFTSPIRRYPDTMVHRLLTMYADGARSANANRYEELCKHCSDQEIMAQQAERDSIKYKAVEFMKNYVGEEFDAHISGITSYGIYCEIDDNHCEGLVPMRDLEGDYYDFDERNYCLVGRHHGNKYQLGDAIRIRVAAANLERKQLDFVLA